MRKLKKMLAVLMTSVMCFSLAAGFSVSAEEETEHSVIVGSPDDPVTFSPWAARSSGRNYVLSTVYQYLVIEVTGTGVDHWVMATGYDKVEDGVYDVYIREGIYDTEGNPFDATDVAFCFNTAVATNNFSKLAGVSVEAIDTYTARFYVDAQPIVNGFTNILKEIWMVTEEAYEASEDQMTTDPVGTTGYVLDDYVTGSHVSFKRADQPYWNHDATTEEEGYFAAYDDTNLDSVRFDFITESTQMAVALQSGAIDFAMNVPSTELTAFQEGGNYEEGFDIYTYFGRETYMSFNCGENSPCSSLNFRKAIAYCFDSEDIVAGAVEGNGQACKALNPHRGDADPKWFDEDYYEYDFDTAQEYLQAYYDETGTSASDIHLVIMTQSGTSNERTAQIMQGYLIALIGTNDCCSIEVYDSQTANVKLLDETAFDIYISAGGAGGPITQFWNQNYNYEASSNGYAANFLYDETLQDLIMEAIGEETSTMEAINETQEYFNEMLYYVPLFVDDAYYVYADWITDVELGSSDSIAICGCSFDWDAKDAR